MGILLDRLAEKKLLVSDGAWGTMLQAKGMTPGSCTEEWNVSNGYAVKSVAKAYGDAGSDLVLTNTFGGSRCKLEKFGFGDRVAEFNQAGARLSIAGAPDAVIAASIGPTGEFLEPLGEMTAGQMEEVFAEQIAAVLAGGVKVVCVETMTALEEAQCAIRAARKVGDGIDVIATMTFDATAQGFKTMMGVDVERAAAGLIEAGADVIGANCGNGIANMIKIAQEYRAVTDKPILIHANAGMPELVNGKTVFRETPADMAGRVGELVDAGANIIGGCCGTTPEHIAAMKEAVDKLR